jgi:hypothetical protein
MDKPMLFRSKPARKRIIVALSCVVAAGSCTPTPTTANEAVSDCGPDFPSDCYVIEDTCVLPSSTNPGAYLSEEGISRLYTGVAACESFGYFACEDNSFWVSAMLDPGIIRADYIEPATITAWSTADGTWVAELANGEHGTGSASCSTTIRGNGAALDCLWRARKTIFERWENGCESHLPAESCEPCTCHSNDMWPGLTDDDCTAETSQ